MAPFPITFATKRNSAKSCRLHGNPFHPFSTSLPHPTIHWKREQSILSKNYISPLKTKIVQHVLQRMPSSAECAFRIQKTDEPNLNPESGSNLTGRGYARGVRDEQLSPLPRKFKFTRWTSSVTGKSFQIFRQTQFEFICRQNCQGHQLCIPSNFKTLRKLTGTDENGPMEPALNDLVR